MKRILCAIAVLSMFCFSATTSLAQSKTGTPPLGTFGGGPFDTINLANLNAHFAISVVQKAGRGIPFDYLLSYDSSIWESATVGSSTLWQPVTNWGWRGQTEAAVGYVKLNINEGTCRDPETGATQIKTTYTYPGYYDEFGTFHLMPVHIVDNPCLGSVTNSGPATATDGSGYTLTATISETATVKGRGGDVSSPPVNNTAGSGNVIDNNGNKLTTTGSSFTDTLGTTALSISGGAPNPLNFTYTGPSNTAVSVTLNYATFDVKTNFQCSGVGEYGPTAVSLVSSVRMPDGTSYTINYEPTPGFPGKVTGRIQSITLPSGGTISYAYSGTNNGINCADGSPAILTRTTPDGTWTYDHTIAGTAGTTTITDPKGNRAVLNFQQIYETQRKVYQGTTTLLQTVQTCYNGAAFPCDGTAITLPITRRTTLVQLPDTSGKVSKQDTFYNSLGLVTETQEYDFGSGAPPATPVRKVLILYATLGNGIADRPSSIQVRDGAGGIKAETTFGYDATAVTATAGTPQHVAITGARGNQTSATYKVQGTTTVGQTFTYFDTGMVKTATDLKGNVTSFTYGACGNSFVTSTSLPLALSRSAVWNCTGGVMTSSTEENNQTTTISYGDPNYWRVTQVNLPDGGQSSTAYNLTTAPWNIVQTTKINATQNLTTKAVFDGLGRVQKQQLTSDPEGITSVDSVYDASGMLQSVSNPYRATNEATYGVTSFVYDALNRPTTQNQPGGNTVSASYSANCVTQTDEAGKQRKSCVDGLGRLMAVFEPDNTGALNWETDYQYDVLDNLIRVDQKGGSTDSAQWRTRTYAYDGLSRLTQATTPESGAKNVFYTTTAGALCSGAAANPCRRTDARNITTTYTYDTLNRILTQSYSNGSPTVSYEYDQTALWTRTLANSKGRLTHQVTGASAERIFSYDAMGRVVDQLDCLPSNCGVSAYKTFIKYDLAGNITELTYPSTRKVSYTYSNAGRPTQVTLTGGSGQVLNYPYVSSVSYAPSGDVGTVTLGNGLTETYTFNNRLQLSTAKLSSSILTAMHYSYAFADTQGNNNNGNVLSIKDELNSARTQILTYDRLNRLASATETAWGLSFVYDAWGNLLQQNQTLGTVTTFNVLVSGNNRIIDPPAFAYDAAGNVTADGAHTYQWDPENRLKSLDTTGATYLYDVNNQRIRRQVGTAVSEYINLGTQLLALKKGADWSDYVFLNGRLLLTVDSFEDRILIQGTNSCSNCGQYSLFTFPSAGGYAGYVIRSGDKLFLRQWQATGSRGGMQITFTDGTNTNWNTYDQDGKQLNNDDAVSAWHYRRADLGAHAGKAISNIRLVSESTTAAGAWSIYFNDIALVSTDGTVRPLYNRNSSISLTASGSTGVTGRTSSINHVSNEVQIPDVTTTYLHSDHLGSGRMTSSVNGYPTWQATYLPFGDEYTNQLSPNSFKFGTYKHDDESDLDYAKFRYYSSQFGRFMSPDPLAGDIGNPQSLNRYAYVLNNPLNLVDPFGLTAEDDRRENREQRSQANIDRIDARLLVGSGGGGGSCYFNGMQTNCANVYRAASMGNGGSSFIFTGYTQTITEWVSGSVLIDQTHGSTFEFPRTTTTFVITGIVGWDQMGQVFNQMRRRHQQQIDNMTRVPTPDEYIQAIADAAPRVCGGGFFAYGGPAKKFGADGESGVALQGFVDFDSRNGFKPEFGGLLEGHAGPIGGGVLHMNGQTEPLIFGGAGLGGIIFFPVSGQVGVYAGGTYGGAGAYVNFTSNAGCR